MEIISILKTVILCMYGGHMDNKKRHYLIKSRYSNEKKYKIEKDIVRNYRLDNARKGLNLYKNCWEIKIIPCFYYNNNSGKISSFGYTPMMRFS